MFSYMSIRSPNSIIGKSQFQNFSSIPNSNVKLNVDVKLDIDF